MMGWELFGIGALAHCLHHTLEGVDSLLAEALLHLKEYVGEDLRIVRRAVMVEVLQAVMLCDGVELMVFQLGVDVLRKPHRVEEGVFKGHFLPLRRHADEADIEVCVMGDQKPVAYEGKKLLH